MLWAVPWRRPTCHRSWTVTGRGTDWCCRTGHWLATVPAPAAPPQCDPHTLHRWSSTWTCQNIHQTRVGRFLPDGGKNRSGKNSFCRKNRLLPEYIFYTFITIKYCCTAYIILTSISVLNSTLLVLVTYLFGRFIWPILPVLSLTNGIVTPTPKLLGTNLWHNMSLNRFCRCTISAGCI